jgi:alcohol dehydrogenase
MNQAPSAADIVAGAVEQARMGQWYEFRTAPQFIVGDGVSARLGEVLAGRGVGHAFFVADPAVVSLGLMDTALRSLRLSGIAATIFECLPGEPTIQMVEEASASFKTAGAGFIVGFGGGSALDTAKAVATLASGVRLEEIGALAGRHLPRPGLAAVPTTAGTGSEVTAFTVITDASGRHKIAARHPCIMPDLALVDPRLTYGLPPRMTAITGLDALTHAIEAYVSKEACTITQALAHRAVMLAFRNLPIAAGSGDDGQARYAMAIASCMAGMAFSTAGLGLCHAMAHQLGARYHLPHGAANALMLPHVMEFNLMVKPAEFGEIARAMGVSLSGLSERGAAEASVAACRRLIRDVGLETDLPGKRETEAGLLAMADGALTDICAATNPRVASREDVIRLYRAVLPESR